ncbi:TBC1 domain family member 16 [Canis lupus baileyi]|uniref:TBC1 domain family member 16 n=1 Tax=Canis lupus baileyi TaxID=143281 RepID=UPI003B975302
MSLGRLLRRASSKASDLLTLTPGGGGGPPSVLDGEIIYSKNNICVHPPEGLQGLGEHHPGYLCLYMEKDELLGSTLILTWVPNSRIQRQDEEALRYITPESSPVRKAPRPRGRRAQSLGAPHQASPTEPRPALIPRDADALGVAQSVPDAVRVSPSPPSEDGDKLARGLGMAPPPAHSDSGILSAVSSQDGTEEGREPRPEAGEEEGSLELSADGVSRDSSFDSDSDAFSSPFCLSPISAALGDSGSSVFLDSESGSPSGADAHLRFPDGTGLLQTPRWDEPQRACALEQICGVFRVDLGQMRSLRLFFSDEACTSGQLVIASRESQYKVFHFHHGGLDKLSDVFQQWKYCAETHLKDQQVADEKTCMQFSIRRPKLPSSETHPEESMYKRLDVAAWLRHLNELGQVEEGYKLRKGGRPSLIARIPVARILGDPEEESWSPSLTNLEKVVVTDVTSNFLTVTIKETSPGEETVAPTSQEELARPASPGEGGPRARRAHPARPTEGGAAGGGRGWERGSAPRPGRECGGARGPGLGARGSGTTRTPGGSGGAGEGGARPDGTGPRGPDAPGRAPLRFRPASRGCPGTRPPDPPSLASAPRNAAPRAY